MQQVMKNSPEPNAAWDLKAARLQPPVHLLTQRHFRSVHFRPILLNQCFAWALVQDFPDNLARGVELARDVFNRISG